MIITARGRRKREIKITGVRESWLKKKKKAKEKKKQILTESTSTNTSSC